MQPLLPKLFLLRVDHLGDPIRIQDEDIPVRQRHRLPGIFGAVEQPHRHARGREVLAATSRRTTEQRWVVPGRGKIQITRLQVQIAHESRGKHLGLLVGDNGLVGAVQQFPGREIQAHSKAQHRHAERHEQRPWNALARDVGDHNGQPSVRQRVKVVKVSGHLAHRAPKSGNVPTGVLGDFLRQETLLDRPGGL